MKSLIQAVAIAVVLVMPVASFAESSTPSAAQDAQSVQAAPAVQQNAAQAASSGYGSGSHGTWQAGYANDTTVSSYSPPIHNAR